MSKEISHFSMFRSGDTDTGYIQCVIKPIYKAEFEALGFVDHPDKIPSLSEEIKAPAAEATKEKKTRTRRTKAQIEADKAK